MLNHCCAVCLSIKSIRSQVKNLIHSSCFHLIKKVSKSSLWKLLIRLPLKITTRGEIFHSQKRKTTKSKLAYDHIWYDGVKPNQVTSIHKCADQNRNINSTWFQNHLCSSKPQKNFAFSAVERLPEQCQVCICLFENWQDFTDITLACEDGKHQVFAHKVVLASPSPFFRDMIDNWFRITFSLNIGSSLSEGGSMASQRISPAQYPDFTRCLAFGGEGGDTEHGWVRIYSNVHHFGHVFINS